MLFVIQVDHDDHGPVPAMYRVKTPKTITRNSAAFWPPRIIRSLCNPWRVMAGVSRNLLFLSLLNPTFCSFKYTIVNSNSSFFYHLDVMNRSGLDVMNVT